MKEKHIKGFTLIELLLVVGIVTLLSSMLFYNTSEAKKKAEDSHMESESKQVELAISMFKNDTGRYPLSVHGPNASVPRDKMYIETDPNYKLAMQELVDKKYLPEIPTSPNNSSYAYGMSDDLDEAVFVVSLNRKKPNSSTESLLCVSSSGQDSSPLCSRVIDSILNPVDENPPPPPPPEYQYLNLSGGDEKVSLSPGSTYEIIYSHGSVNVTYELGGSTSNASLWTWFNPDFTFSITEMSSGWSCDTNGGLISEGETANCVNSNNENIQITNYDSENRIIRITGSLE